MLPEDVWFHVDNLSSAHVYLRLKEVSIKLLFICFMYIIIELHIQFYIRINGAI